MRYFSAIITEFDPESRSKIEFHKVSLKRGFFQDFSEFLISLRLRSGMTSVPSLTLEFFAPLQIKYLPNYKNLGSRVVDLHERRLFSLNKATPPHGLQIRDHFYEESTEVVIAVPLRHYKPNSTSFIGRGSASGLACLEQTKLRAFSSNDITFPVF